MAKRKPREQTIFFPWERPASLIRRLGISRARLFAAFAAFVLLFGILGFREKKKIGERLTRATIGSTAAAVDKYRADHDGKCPESLNELKPKGYVDFEPVDAWGRPLRLICPGFEHPERYDLISDGPDGAFGGLDRIQ